MPMQAQTFSGAFSEPVFQSQAVFRTLMDCMARPGTIGRIETVVRPPKPLSPAAGAVALTLCDHETPVWLTPALAKSSLPQWLAFHAGATVTEDKHLARFAFVEAGAPMPGLSLFAQGTQEYPDRSTTLVVELDALEGGQSLLLKGPGIRDEATIAPIGLPETFLLLWTANRQGFPRGVDLVLVAGERVVCLPRTTNIDKREG
ncbi:phosphonate C-P lyase system protein PhnH [Sinorhizobium sp. BG8]|uniref:phosphonate C-P lyase system protein PhnH n=1 Tax=Sinorhizobium sp. BG8 TaxID=2613773 RepID=UPI00193D95D0|nr:phosphonate C-P lyase system protein PhnH [Sinorhizobium sp. BG8]QRM54322.1 phosphonate C-P lyase system protein PhnH [Sinorhizobium sp. BG8]